ncbi:MAG: hypothetical protein H6550_08455 [Chitinophagales bacterium]|nr:hypothetical protein [Chitinophagales bacterium]
MDILLSIFCSWRNGQLAKQKGVSVAKWVTLTFLAYFGFYLIGGTTLLGIMYNGPYTQSDIFMFMQSHPLLVVTIMFFGLGGYLLVRRILEQMPDSQREE